MTFKIISTQPEIYNSFLKTGLISRGIERKLIDVEIHNLYDYAFDKHKSIDDTPYGGGAGMVIKVDVVSSAIEKIQNQKKSKVILLTPQGKPFAQEDARRLAQEKELIIISGRFEGYDERIRDLVDEEISIGDYILTSGDLPAMVLVDAISRQVPKFIDRGESIKEESFSEGLLEYPQYTRPENFKDKRIPEILLSGDHGKISNWRKEQATKRTKERRSDLLGI